MSRKNSCIYHDSVVDKTIFVLKFHISSPFLISFLVSLSSFYSSFPSSLSFIIIIFSFFCLQTSFLNLNFLIDLLRSHFRNFFFLVAPPALYDILCTVYVLWLFGGPQTIVISKVFCHLRMHAPDNKLFEGNDHIWFTIVGPMFNIMFTTQQATNR